MKLSNITAAGVSRFWEQMRLSEMTPEQWESLCDRCGKCCLHKLQEEDTGVLHFTNVSCELLDLETGCCSDYENRRASVPDCVRLRPDQVAYTPWLPGTCAYRLLADGQPLPPWHHLECGDFESVQECGRGVRGRSISEADADALEDHIVDWDDL